MFKLFRFTLTGVAFFFAAPKVFALPSLEPGVDFFRSSASLFASGQASRTELEAKLQRSEYELRYLTQWNKKSFHLKGESFIREIQVARFVETRTAVQLLSERKSNAKTLESLPAKSPLEILESDAYWARVLNPKTKTSAFLPLHLLQAKSEDPGVMINLVDTFLRKNPGAAVTTTIPRLTRLVPLEFKKQWVRVRYQNFEGYVDLNHFVSKSDFARYAFAKNKWQAVTHRENNTVVGTNGEHFSLSEVRGFITTPTRGVITENSGDDKMPPLQARIEILKPEANIWAVSILPKHGEVWWKKQDLKAVAFDQSSNRQAMTSSDILTTEQILKRKIFSMAFEKKKLRGLVSAEGVFRTDDGNTWTPISDFKGQNLPVSIAGDGSWYVGAYKSLDQGASFEPFIRWERLAQTIHSSIHRAPANLRLTKIESLPSSQIQIQVDAGGTKLSFRNNASSTGEWKLVRQ